ncbi:hypothetical protein CEXT_90881 [Caerostris extrusa]|uniref:Uncharacterized protein n=1 Tax=Caerostris extrusa TaxID=172846 RepID=A0AAV4S5Q6_CAEEX|nr:hypothetical protein CEXT_90881 [Caerostris extrusa]
MPARVQLLSEIQILFWALLQSVFMHVCNYMMGNAVMGYCSRCFRICCDIMHVCNYYLIQATSGFYSDRCFQDCRVFTYATISANPHMGSIAVAVFGYVDIMHVCNYYLIRILFWALLQSFSDLSFLYTCATITRIPIHFWALLQSIFSELSRFCTYATTI